MKTNTLTPALPAIGRGEGYYAALARDARADGDPLALCAAKVGQYVTLAAAANHLPWDERVKYFHHALTKYCVAPRWGDEDVSAFFRGLVGVVRAHAGRAALRLASDTDDLYAVRLAMGQPREQIEDEAETFFATILPGQRPEWFTPGDYEQLKLIRDHWI